MKIAVVVSGLTFWTLSSFFPHILLAAEDKASSSQVSIKVVPAPEQTQAVQFRRTIVGPRFNQPKPYSGYAGFVGWTGVTRTKAGTLLVAFSSGYWHASPPTEPAPLPTDFRELFDRVSGIDLWTFNAPRGDGRKSSVLKMMALHGRRPR